MKKTLALILALIMTFGAYGTVFAQTVQKGLKYNVVVDGNKIEFSGEEAIYVDGVTMFTLDSYKSKFGCPGLTDESIKSAKAFEFEGKQYYPLREVAKAANLRVFWDSATATALIVDESDYSKIKELIDASNMNNKDVKKMEMEMNGKFGISMDVAGESMNVNAPVDAEFKIDLDASFMEAVIKVNVQDLGLDTSLRMYDDGEFTYSNYGEDWYKSPSSLAQSKGMIEQLNGINPATNALAEDLSIAGLKLTETADGYVVEGDMYVAETFKGIDIDEIMKQMYAEMDIDFSLKYDWPNTMYVKYVLDKEGNVKEMYIKFGIGMDISAEGETMSLKMDADIGFPKFVIDGEFETVVPQAVKDAAVDINSLTE